MFCPCIHQFLCKGATSSSVWLVSCQMGVLLCLLRLLLSSALNVLSSVYSPISWKAAFTIIAAARVRDAGPATCCRCWSSEACIRTVIFFWKWLIQILSSVVCSLIWWALFVLFKTWSREVSTFACWNIKGFFLVSSWKRRIFDLKVSFPLASRDITVLHSYWCSWIIWKVTWGLLI